MTYAPPRSGLAAGREDRRKARDQRLAAEATQRMRDVAAAAARPVLIAQACSDDQADSTLQA